VCSWGHGDAEWKNGNTALVSGDSHVAFLAPASAPGVLNDEEVGTVSVSSVSDSGHSVVDVRAAAGLDDTTAISSELVIFGLDGDGEWSFSDGSLHVSDSVSNLDKALWDLLCWLTLLLASALSCLVWVVTVRDATLLFDGEVGPGWMVETTVAAIAAARGVCDAINELLLRESHNVTLSNEIGTLHGSSSGESPAGTAGTLILDSGDTIMVSPVE